MRGQRARTEQMQAWLFLLPNLLGFALFTAGPVVFSLWLAFTDTSLVKHNAFSDTPVKFVGLRNFARILWGDESRLFWESMGNTAYLMLGIPIGIVGSLLVALMLNRPVGPARAKGRWMVAGLALAVGVVSAGASLLVTWPAEQSAGEQTRQVEEDGSGAQRQDEALASELARRRAMAIAALLVISGAVVAAGSVWGVVFFRTLFYLPSLLSGIALFLLWKSLYKPTGGAINVALQPMLDGVQGVVSGTAAGVWYGLGIAVWGLGGGLTAWLGWKLIGRWREGDVSVAGLASAAAGLAMLAAVCVGMGYGLCQLPERALFATGYAPLTGEALAGLVQRIQEGQWLSRPAELDLLIKAVGGSIQPRVLLEAMQGLAVSAEAEGLLREATYGAATVLHEGWTSGAGLTAPKWLVDETWAKTALIVMGVWTSVGGGNMLLYLAGLSNIPEELYEAAAIDGAKGWSRFWNVTWPQLGPTTFFIVIMATIGGLQGGFDQARAMTGGQYGTEVVTYYLYKLAFTDEFQLGLASAVAWTMFAMIFVMTVVNYRFGSRAVNE